MRRSDWIELSIEALRAKNRHVSHIETLRVVHLGSAARVLRIVHYRGRCLQVDLPFRAILADILNLGSRALILTHNHPLGDPSPSNSDVMATLHLASVLRVLNVRLHDHIVIGTTGHVSFRAAGLL